MAAWATLRMPSRSVVRCASASAGRGGPGFSPL